MAIRVVTNPLIPSPSEEEYRIHCGALEWSLAEPIIINSAEDIKSRGDWKDRVQPFSHQVQNLIRFCRRLPVTLLADDVGLGKTISAGLIVSELIKRSKVSKVFVICPKILIRQWQEEMESKFGIEAFGAVGNDLVHCRKRTEPIVVTTYQSATSFLSGYRGGVFDMLILDEAHKVRNLHGSNSSPKMARTIYGALEARLFKYVLMLTATPIQNRLWDIYSLIDCLAVARGHRNPLGAPGQFAAKYIADSKNTARRLKQESANEFRSIVSSYMFRTRRVDAKLAFPERQVQTYQVEPTPGELKLQQVIAGCITQFNGLEQISLLVALMSSPQALAAQLENMAIRGTARTELSQTVRAITQQIPRPAKAAMILKIADDLRRQNEHWRMVVFTTRKETQRMIGEALERAGIAHGFISGSAQVQNERTIDAFRAEPPRIHVLVSTDAGAEGVNLQAANVLVNYDLPWNPMIVEQRIGRVQRIGSKFRNVWVANVVHRDSPEQRIVVRLLEKLQVIAHTVGDIEAVLEATDDPDGETLERQIRDMVIASLRGQDEENATRLKEKSIEDAKKLIEQSQQEMEQTLGNGHEQDNHDVPMPRLRPAIPSVSYRDLVLRALAAEGAEITEIEPELFSARSHGLGEEKFTFDERIVERSAQPGIFMGRAPLLYQPGKPAFERLVQRWIDRSASWVRDSRSAKDDALHFAQLWLASIPDATLLDTRHEHRDETLCGSLLCRTRVSNAIDSYEKLISVPFDASPGANAREMDLDVPIQVKSIVPSIEQAIRSRVEQDQEITRFTEYYLNRLGNELQKSEPGARREKLENDLSPSLSADVSAVEGALSSTMAIKVRYRIGGELEYESRIAVKDGSIIQEPPRAECAVTHRKVPVDCIERCCVTGKRAIRDLLVRSEASGEYALKDVVVVCAVSGIRIHKNDCGTCCISGLVVDKRLLEASELSGRQALPQYMTYCEITETCVIEDELETSSISNRRFRKDQKVVLENGGLIAHPSEAVQCHYSSKWFQPSECAQSDVTGQPVSKARIVVSSVSGRKCDASEAVECEVTGAWLLPDETARCSVSGKRVLVSLLSSCPDSGKMCLDLEMEACDESGVRVAKSELVQCCITGKSVRRSLTATSPASGKRALFAKLQACEESEGLFLPEELAVCQVTQKLCDRRMLATCEVSGELALKRVMRKCSVTSKSVLPNLLIQCPDSNQWALEQQLIKCEESGMKVVPSEIVDCAVTGKRVRKKLTAPSAASGKTGLVHHMSKCEVSGKLFLPVEIGCCEVSSKHVDRRLLGKCESSGKQVQKSLLQSCVLSEKKVSPDLVSRCAETGSIALAHLMVRCEETGALVLPDQIETCRVTDKRVRRSLLGRSDISGEYCLKRLVVRCAMTNINLLPTESGVCSVTGLRVDARSLKACSYSGEFALEEKMVQSKATGKWMLPSYSKRLPNGVVVGNDEVALCAWTKRYRMAQDTAQCVLCGLVFAKQLMNAQGEFKLLRECLDGSKVGIEFPEPGYLARILPKDFAGVTAFHWISSSTGNVHILFGKKSIFGLNSKIFAVLAEGDLKGLRLHRRVLWGRRSKGTWQPLENES